MQTSDSQSSRKTAAQEVREFAQLLEEMRCKFKRNLIEGEYMLNPIHATRENMMNETTVQGNMGKTNQKTAAQKVLDFAQATVELAEKVRIQAEQKLLEVVLPPIKDDEKKLEVNRQPFPPLFENLQCSLGSIQHNLNLLSDLLSRTEL